MGTKDYSLKWTNQSEGVQLASIAKPLTLGLIREPKMSMTPTTAQAEGTNIVRACKSKEFKLWFLARLKKLSDSLDCQRRLSTTEEYTDCIDEILAVVPALTIEEIELVFRKFERGQIETYGRLKTPDIVKALLEYDGTTACDVRESRHKAPADPHNRICENSPRSFLSLTEQDLIDLGQVQTKPTNPTSEQD